MKIYLYNCEDSYNTINKNLFDEAVKDVVLKNNINISYPIVRLKAKGVINKNYCYIPRFERYYFIQDNTIINNNMQELYLKCDVLETFKDDILNSVAEYYINIGDGDYIDFNNVIDTRKDIDIYKSNKSIELGSTTILTTVGDGNNE